MKYIYGFLSLFMGFISLLFIAGYVQMYFGIVDGIPIPIVLENTSEYEMIKYELIGQDIGTPIVLLVFLLLTTRFYALYKRSCKRKKDTFDKESINGPFILYLRSFLDDSKTSRFVSVLTDSRTEEEILVDVFSDIAPVYAIGDPKDVKMPNGASRIYVDDEHWKSVVEELAKKATLVVLRLGATDCFWWEVEMALERIPIEKIVFIVPESKTFNNVAILYKMLLDHGIDIKDLNITIERKNKGSISSLLYFDSDRKPYTSTINVAGFTQFVISYENVLRNNLDKLRQRFGLSTRKMRTVRLARICQALLVCFIVFIAGSKMFSDYVSLKYQMPYELVEECVKEQEFVNKYSDDINATNLAWSIYESTKGMFALDNEEFLTLYLLEASILDRVEADEYAEMTSAPKNKLLLAKKYMSEEDYNTYVSILSEATLLSINYPTEVNDLIKAYQENLENIPQWVFDFFNDETEYQNDLEFDMNFILTVLEHMDEPDISDVLKTISSQNIRI